MSYSKFLANCGWNPRLVEEQLAAAARDRQLAQDGESYPTTDAEHDLF
jgi:hypothetical protein